MIPREILALVVKEFDDIQSKLEHMWLSNICNVLYQ
jgi:hypothetical protein